MSPALHVALIGTPTLSRAAGPALALERRDAGVLALLVIEGQASRGRLLQLLWADADPQVARNHLRQRLHRLKRAAGRDVVTGTELLRLAPGVETDLAAAPAAASGELLAGLSFADHPEFDAWLAQQRARLQRALADAVVAELDRLESEARVDEAIGIAERLVALAPLEEHAYRRLMRLHYLRGDRAAAIAAFERGEATIRAELGTRPSAETIALLDTIERAAPEPSKLPVRTVPAAITRPPRVIGRDAELAALLAAAATGRVGLVVAAGGLGKSRLLTELARSFDRCIAVRARPGDAGVPYALLARFLRVVEQHDAQALAAMPVEVLGAILPERMGDATASVSTPAIRGACERLLARELRDRALLCTLDDLHCADAASIELFTHLMSAESLERCRWALARRPELAPDDPADALARALADANRLVVVKLAALDEARIGELLESLALPGVAGERLASALARHTGGNPLFVLETLKQAILDGGLDQGRLPRPTSVVESIERRIASLTRDAQALVQVAAAAGADFSVALAASVLQASALALAEPWRELEGAQLIDGDAFVHDLVHEAVLGWVPQPILRHLYGAVADYLASGHADAARVADLWLAAGEVERAAPALLAAAEAARRAGRFVEAGQRGIEAARAHERLGRDDLAFAELYAAFDDLSTHAPRAVFEPLAHELTRRAHTEAQSAMAALAQAQMASLSGDWGAMERALAAALAAAQRAGDRALEAEARFGLGILAHSRGELAETVDQIGASASLLHNLGGHVREAEMRGSLARVLYLLGRVPEACAELDLAIPILREAKVGNELAANTGFRALLALEAGEHDEAIALAHESERLLDVAEAGAHEWLTATGDRIRVLATASRYDEALEAIRLARNDARFEALPAHTRIVETEAAILFELGRHWHGERLLQPLAATDGGIVGYRASRAVLSVHADHLRQRAVRAERLEQARELVRSIPQRCRYAAVAGPHLPADAALELCTSTLELAEGLGLKGHVPGLLACRADALRRSGHAEEAVRAARRAARLLDHVTPLTYRGSIWLLVHDVLSALAEPDIAREVLLHASEWLHRVAREHVPTSFRDSFLGRNAVNRELLIRAIKADIASAR